MIKNKTIKKKYNYVVTEYINIFCEMYDHEFEGWVGNLIGTFAELSSYMYIFDDIRYFVDNNINKRILYEWRDYNEMKRRIKPEAFFKLRGDKKSLNTQKFYEYLDGLKNNNYLNEK